MKILGIVAVDVVRESRKFSGHPYVGRIARSSLRKHSFLVQLSDGQTDKQTEVKTSPPSAEVKRRDKFVRKFKTVPMF